MHTSHKKDPFNWNYDPPVWEYNPPEWNLYEPPKTFNDEPEESKRTETITREQEAIKTSIGENDTDPI